MADLELDSRDGLPDGLAYLRASYPKDEWQSSSNFGELTRFWLSMHEGLRTEGTRIQSATDQFREGRLNARAFHRFFVPALSQFLQHLNGHHQVEDYHYFPKFRLLDDRMVAGFDLLDRDHHRIHAAILSSAEAANAFLAAFAKDGDALVRAGDLYADQSANLLALLTRHLADEEDLVVPAMLHFGEQAVS